MNTKAKGDAFCLEIKQAAEAKGLEVLKVRSSGHMGRRGGIPADLVVEGWRVEAKRLKGGIGSKAVGEILLSDQGVGVVAHRADDGIALVTIGLEDFLDLLAQVRSGEVGGGTGASGGKE